MRGGIVSVESHVYLSTHNNAVDKSNELTGFTSGTVAIGESNVVPSSFTFVTNSRNTVPGTINPLDLPSFQKWIAPFIKVSWQDDSLPGGRYSAGGQLGNYILLPPSYIGGGNYTAGQYVAQDILYLLSRDCFDVPFTAYTGQQYDTVIRNILGAGGITRHLIDQSSKTLPLHITWPAGTNRLKACNDLAAEMGFYPLWADWTGRVMSRLIDSASNRQAIVTIDSDNDDIVETVVFTPDLSNVANRVRVIGTSPTGNSTSAPIVAIRNNTRADSPTSQTVLMGDSGSPVILYLEINDPRIKHQDTADRRAAEALEKATSNYVSASVRCRPNPILNFREPITLDIDQLDGTSLATGKWRWTDLSIGFTPQDGAMSLIAKKLLPFGETI